MDLLATPLAFAILFNGIGVPPLPSSEAVILELRSLSRSENRCRDRFLPARHDTGTGRVLDRAPVSPEKPHHLYALDMRVNGCNVMVVKSGSDRIRPLPRLPIEPQIIPMREGK